MVPGNHHLPAYTCGSSDRNTVPCMPMIIGSTRYNGAVLGKLPVPAIADDEVLVRVRYSTVNRTDCGFLRASGTV